MRNTKRFIILAASLLLVTGIIGMFFTYSSAYGKTTVQQEKTVDEAFNAIDIQISDATVEVMPTDANTSEIVLEGKQYKKDNNENLSVDVKNDKLAVKLKSQHQLINFDFFHSTVSLKVYVPQKQYATLHVSADNGKIDVQQIKVEHIDLHSDNGIVDLRQVSGETVKATTGNGKVRMDEVDGEIIGHTDNGIISLKTTHLDRDIELKTGNGKIDVQTENEPTNTTFVANTGNGTVNILDQYSGGTVIGDGDHVVELTTDNGMIKVTKRK